MERKIKGNIKDIPISAVLRSLYQNQRTGTLDIKRQNTLKKIFFQDGQIIFAVSSDINDRIGIYCLKRSLITIKELEESIRIQKNDRIGKTLLNMGAISEKCLISAVQNHLEEIVYSIFSFSDGEYIFTSKDMPNENIKIKKSTGSLIFKGVKRMGQWNTIRKAVGGLETIYCLSDNPIFRYQELRLNTDEQQILKLIDGRVTTSEICEHSNLSDYYTYKTLFGFISCGIIERVHNIISPEPSILKDIAIFLNNISKIDDLKLFNLEESYTKEQLEVRYKQLIQKFHPDKIHRITNREDKINGIKILKRIMKAYEILSKNK